MAPNDEQENRILGIKKGLEFIADTSNKITEENLYKLYYDAFTTIEENKKFSGKIDITPFIIYFIKNGYNKICENQTTVDTLALYEESLKSGKITEKEKELWQFVLSFYDTDEFSTKQLEKDFGNAAYATIGSFVLKFEELGLLSLVKYGIRVKYRVI